MDRLQLLAQVVLALVAVDLVADAVLDAPLQNRDVDLRRQVHGHAFEPTQGIADLQERLPSRNICQELGCQEIGQVARVRCALHHVLDFYRQGAACIAVTVRQVLDVGNERPGF